MENEEFSDQQVIQQAIDNIFDKYDINKNKHLQLGEVVKLMKDLTQFTNSKCHRLERKDIIGFFNLVDTDRDGKISKRELSKALNTIFVLEDDNDL